MQHSGVFITELEPEPEPDREPAGLRLAVKDLFDTAGVRTTYGSAIFRDHIPSATAEAVTRLEAAGYTNVGKANLHEFAYGVTSDNEHYGRVPNPLAPDRTSGGSSGGSAAALGLGLADGALGTDSGGSIRIPAACCGVTGFKPSFGLVPIDGCFPLAPSFDHAGPMARDVAGCVRMMAALVPGFTVGEPPALGELQVGVAWTSLADPLVHERVHAAAARFGHARPLELPLLSGTGPLFGREVAEVHARLWREHRELYGRNVADKLELAMGVTDAEAEAARRARELYREQLAELMAGVDLVLTPTVAMVAPPAALGEPPVRERLLQFTYPWNAIGAPALALPCGPAEDGLPASVQLIARPGEDRAVLAAGRALERELERLHRR
jgi:aspartyl-tRNA(Asn)/glutamyl-tRNA(Gln) amidotransferase subunit A